MNAEMEPPQRSSYELQFHLRTVQGRNTRWKFSRSRNQLLSKSEMTCLDESKKP